MAVVAMILEFFVRVSRTDIKKLEPITGWRATVIKLIYKLNLPPILSGYRIRVINSDFDYSYYLGKDYKRNQQLPKKTSTIVSNHTSWLDAPVLIAAYHPGFCVNEESRSVPFLNTLIDCLNSVYIQRQGSPAQRKQMLEAISHRQQLGEKDPRFNQFVIFPEGTQSNGAYLGTFKKGGFASLQAVQPCVMKYNWNKVDPSWNCTPFAQHHMLVMSQFWLSTVDVHTLPTFMPNEFLFREHADRGAEKWEIYAWAVREVMAKFGGFKLT